MGTTAYLTRAGINIAFLKYIDAREGIKINGLPDYGISISVDVDSLVPVLDSAGYITKSAVEQVVEEAITSGGYLKEPEVIVDSTTTSAYIPVLSGGVQYLYTQPLTTLNIDSAVNSPVVGGVVFSAGVGIQPPSDIKIYGLVWEDLNGRFSYDDFIDEDPEHAPKRLLFIEEKDNS